MGGAGVSNSQRGTEIVVMPDKYFGQALKMDGKTQEEMSRPAPVAPKTVVPAGPLPKRTVWPYILIIILCLFIISGAFIWFNYDALFPKPTPVPSAPVPVVVKPAPNAPSSLNATATTGTSPAIHLSWIDGGGEKTGFRIERREGTGTFLPLTPLSPSSLSFLDVTVDSGRRYEYRVIAIGPGGESAPSNVAFSQPESIAVVPAAPSLPPGGLDSDSDGLSDIEEAALGTDAHAPDTDRDGFLDGNEVFHLYNPMAKAPVRLLDSGIVTSLSATAGWSLYVPKGWTTSMEVTDGSKATLRTGQGEAFRISIEDNPQHLDITAWYLAQHPGVKADQLRTLETKGGLTGVLGPDRMDANIAWDGKVFVLKYDNGEKPFINFRTTYEMILNSLTLSGAPVLAPVSDQVLGGPGEFLQTTSTALSASSTTSTP
jgi:hypothetical protein